MQQMKNSIKPPACSHLKWRQRGRIDTRHRAHFFAQVGLKISQYSLLSQVVKLAPVPLAWKTAQLALKQPLGKQRVAALH